MGWTIEQFDNQPQWFIETLLLKWVEDTAYQKSKSEVK